KNGVGPLFGAEKQGSTPLFERKRGSSPGDSVLQRVVPRLVSRVEAVRQAAVASYRGGGEGGTKAPAASRRARLAIAAHLRFSSSSFTGFSCPAGKRCGMPSL